jgi:hypothetical protein
MYYILNYNVNIFTISIDYKIFSFQYILNFLISVSFKRLGILICKKDLFPGYFQPCKSNKKVLKEQCHKMGIFLKDLTF